MLRTSLPLMAMLALLAIVIRALVPVGYMPEFSNGKMAITICHGADIKTIFVDSDAPPQKGKAVNNEGCPYAPVNVSHASFDVPSGVADVFAYTSIIFTAFTALYLARRKRLLEPSRAPPVFS